jgi:hypothetical protein
MTSKQYEELCRAFVAELFQIGVDRVRSIDVITPAGPGLAEYAHQIDLFIGRSRPTSPVICTLPTPNGTSKASR